MPNVSPHQASRSAPSVVFSQGKFWMTFWSDSSNAIFWGVSSDGANWTDFNGNPNLPTLNGQFASAPPAIGLYKNTPTIVYAQVPPGGGAPPTILYTVFDVIIGDWTSAKQVPSGDSATSVSAIGSYDGSGDLLVLFREATDSTIDFTKIT
jgi:hypothetical protein